jgi:hypothetical protein
MERPAPKKRACTQDRRKKQKCGAILVPGVAKGDKNAPIFHINSKDEGKMDVQPAVEPKELGKKSVILNSS